MPIFSPYSLTVLPIFNKVLVAPSHIIWIVKRILCVKVATPNTEPFFDIEDSLAVITPTSCTKHKQKRPIPII